VKIVGTDVDWKEFRKQHAGKLFAQILDEQGGIHWIDSELFPEKRQSKTVLTKDIVLAYMKDHPLAN
jgi:hypothetical protein